MSIAHLFCNEAFYPITSGGEDHAVGAPKNDFKCYR